MAKAKIVTDGTPTGHGKLWGMVHGKCPRCFQGGLFRHSSFSMKFKEMHADCDCCGLHFEIEPGFFWGCMYISYALTVGIGIALAVATYYLLHDPATWVYMSIIVAALVISSPPLFRISRIIMLYMFGSIDHDPSACESYKRKEPAI